MNNKAHGSIAEYGANASPSIRLFISHLFDTKIAALASFVISLPAR
jgi:hypothetical protein